MAVRTTVGAPDVRSLGWAIRLACRLEEHAPADLDWQLVWSFARRERLAMACWLRNGALIRRTAPATVAMAWRRHALAADVRRRAQRDILREVLAAFSARGLRTAVLKGQPLGVLAYGDAAARVSTDVDLFVDRERRSAIAPILVALGWRHRAGAAPWDETWERDGAGPAHFLEIHSQLMHDTLAHHRLVPRSFARVDIGGMTVNTLAGPELIVFLAAHAVAHVRPSLLWYLDIARLWSAMAPGSREEAHRTARDARLARHLAWGLAQAEQLVLAADLEARALEALGVTPDGSRVDEPFRRALALAPSMFDAARVAGAWAWPRPLRTSPRGTLALVRRRGAALLRGKPADTMHASEDDRGDGRISRPLQLGRADMVELVRESIAAGTALWVHVRGASMAPAIPPDSLVRLCPLPARSLRKGDVVFAVLSSGLPVLHRVVRLDGETIHLQGDALPRPDSPVPVGEVIAYADRVRRTTGETAMPGRGRRPWRRLGFHWYGKVLRPTRTR